MIAIGSSSLRQILSPLLFQMRAFGTCAVSFSSLLPFKRPHCTPHYHASTLVVKAQSLCTDGRNPECCMILTDGKLSTHQELAVVMHVTSKKTAGSLIKRPRRLKW